VVILAEGLACFLSRATDPNIQGEFRLLRQQNMESRTWTTDDSEASPAITDMSKAHREIGFWSKWGLVESKDAVK